MALLRRRGLWAAGAAALSLGLALTVGLYRTGHPAVARQLCEWGLPNPTLPHRYRRNWSNRRCTIFSDRRRFHGIWTTGFEHSGFFPGRFIYESIARNGITYQGIWLSADRDSDPGNLLPPVGNPRWELGFLVTFDGWITVAGEGPFGHLGGYSEEILVDRFIRVEPPPEPAERDYARWRRMLKADTD